MTGKLRQIITASEDKVRNQSLDAFCNAASLEDLLAECDDLENFRQRSENLYERVRALFFLYAIHRFHLPTKIDGKNSGLIPFKGYEHLLQRRFEEAIQNFLSLQKSEGPSDGISSALANAYYRLGIQTLADQVRRSVRSVRGNQWMFRMGHPADQPLRIHPELLRRDADGTFPILRERTPVRMDLTHSAWSDIFFLGMDFPEGAKVLNISVDLGVRGRDTAPKPPIEVYLRVIDEPVLRLTSVDLGATADIRTLAEVFDFAKDYLGLLKAAVIAAGIVPPGIEGSGQNLSDLLGQIVGAGRGLEIVSSVNDIPKGSRLAVSTNLLAGLVSVCMRATSQAQSLEGQLQENERRVVLARALLGEWLGGSGGGWQDSGGVWPGMKLIQGALAEDGDAEYGISRGRLMPTHKVFSETEIPKSVREHLQHSLVLVHGGMAQNVGPILEMVTEKYLLRSEAEWKGRQEALKILDEILVGLWADDIKKIGAATSKNFHGPIQTIIPWASTFYTETLIERVRAEFKEDFWGFWMLGGMSGGGMGFIFSPDKKAAAQSRLQEIMSATKRELENALPFAMEPVVYDFAINERGTFADLLHGDDSLMPQSYYALVVPPLLRTDLRSLPISRRAELDKFAAASKKPELRGLVQNVFDRLLPRLKHESSGEKNLSALLEENGFDRAQHEQIRADLRDGRIGLAQNRLSASTKIEDVRPEDVVDATKLVGQAPPPVTSLAGALACSEIPPFRAFDPARPASITRRHLPHWQQEGCTYFVTFRLADSAPTEFKKQWSSERAERLRQLAQATEVEQEEATALFSARFEDELDRGVGKCALTDPVVAAEVERSLRHFDGKQYALGSFVIMPNHVHALVRPLMQHTLSDILQAWKSVSAHNVKKAVGTLKLEWQDESFDHIVRDEQQLQRFQRYIEQNPVRARLDAVKYRLGCGIAGKERQAGAPVGLVTGEGAGPTSVKDYRRMGGAALQNGEVAVVTLSAGVGSRWTQGAGVVKALHPFSKLAGKHRTFIETHLAKSRKIGRQFGAELPHVFTTSYLTHDAIENFLAREKNYGYAGPLLLSAGRAIGLRMIPTERDLRFMWEEMPQQLLDEQAQKVRESLHAALINWAKQAGEASDYTDNVPSQCLHPVGHWYEIPNLLRNGVLLQLLRARPNLKYLMLHNIDTLGANVDPALLGLHIDGGACLSFEMITRRIEDRGGGLARVNGRVRILEGLSLPREEDEFNLSYYNSLTTWINLEKLLAAFELSKSDLENSEKVSAAIRKLAARMPTYITLKDVKKRWGHGQEDIFPVAQFEKLWGDMSALPEIESRFFIVPRLRGQQLKDQAQLDGWLRDGSAAYVESLCEWK